MRIPPEKLGFSLVEDIFFLFWRSPKFGQKNQLNLSEDRSKSGSRSLEVVSSLQNIAKPHHCKFLATRLASTLFANQISSQTVTFLAVHLAWTHLPHAVRNTEFDRPLAPHTPQGSILLLPFLPPSYSLSVCLSKIDSHPLAFKCLSSFMKALSYLFDTEAAPDVKLGTTFLPNHFQDHFPICPNPLNFFERCRGLTYPKIYYLLSRSS